MSEKEEKEEAEKSKQLVERAFRWPKYGAAERLVSQLLFNANNTNNKSTIIQNACRAAMKVETLLGEGEKIKGVDFPLLRGIYSINNSLDNAETIKFDGVWYHGRGWVYKIMRRIHWNFDVSTEEGKQNYEKFIKPWFKTVACWMEFLKLSKQRRSIVNCPRCSYELLNENSKQLKEIMENKATLYHVLAEMYGETKTIKVLHHNPRWPYVDNAPRYVTKELELHYIICPNCEKKIRLEKTIENKRDDYLSRNRPPLPEQDILKSLEQEDTVENLKVLEKESFDLSRPWLFFYEATWFLKESGLLQLRNSFYDWAVPLCEDASVKLSQLISPETLQDIERIMAAQKTGGEGESEAFLETR